MHVLKQSLIIPLLMRGGAVWQLVGLITRRSQVQILPPLPSKEIAFEVLLRRRFSLLFASFPSDWGQIPFPAEKGSDPRPRTLHQRGAVAIISGLAVPLKAASQRESGPGRRAATGRHCRLQPESSHRSLSGKGAQRALCRFRGVMFPRRPRPAPNHRDQGRL